MSAWAKPGVKCVCIDATPRNRRWRGRSTPVLGATYTVRDTIVCPNGRVGIYLEELSNPSVFVVELGAAAEWCFDATRFRPLAINTQAQDVALFEHLLTEAPAPELVE